MKKIKFSYACLAALLVLALFAGKTNAESSVAATPAKKPNIVFILADDLGWGDLGCYGHEKLRTPNLDRMAHDGRLFTQFYVNACLCSPSRVAYLTGQFPARHGIHYWMADSAHNRAHGLPDFLDPAVTTVPKLLRQAGYVTGHFGKWHMGAGKGAPPVNEYGFDEAIVHCQGNGTNFGLAYDDPRSTEKIVDATIDFLRRHRGQPTFVQTWFKDVHAALQPTPESLARYSALGVGAYNGPNVPQIYYAAVTEMDWQVGRLLDFLEQEGMAKDTLVLFASDNGPEDSTITHAARHAVGSTGPFRGRKWSLYEGGIRLPFIVQWKGTVPAGTVDDRSVTAAADFLPTLCRLAGQVLPAEYAPDGQDITDALLGKPFQRSKPLFGEYRFEGVGERHNRSPMLAIRDGDWKLLMNPDRSRVELYKIPEQPMELDNRADQNPQVVERLSKLILQWQQELPKGPTASQPGSNDYPWPKPPAR